MTRMVGDQVWAPLYVNAGADTNGVELEVQAGHGGFAAGCFQLSGTLTSVIVYFECTLDGTNWVSLNCMPVGGTETLVTQATAAGVWRFNALGLKKVRARLDWTTGSVTAYGSLVG